MTSKEFQGSRKEPNYHLARLDLMGKSPSPEYIQDEESASICPLLTPNSASPSELDPLTASLEQKMLLSAKSPSPDFTQDEEAALLALSPITPFSADPLRTLAFDRQETPTSADTERANDGEQLENRNALAEGSGQEKFKSRNNDLLDSSASSSSFALQENNPCTELLGAHLYQQLNKDKINDVTTFITQETCSKQTDCFDSTGRKVPPDYCFLTWNWPVIRKTCFWSAVSLMLACLCLVISVIAMVPRRCYPQHYWYQGTVFYEIFPGSFQDGDHDGIGDLRGIASRAEYLAKLGVSAIRLNSIFPSEHYPEGFRHVSNLTEIEKTLGTMKDFSYLRTVMRSKNISIVLDLPISPLVKDLGETKVAIPRKNGRKDIAERITSVVSSHRSHRSLENDTEFSEMEQLTKDDFEGNKKMLRPYIDGGIAGLMKYTSEHLTSISQTLVVEALYFWFDNGVDGIYIKGLENYVDDPRFLTELKKWKEIKESYRNEGEDKMLMCDYKVLQQVQDDETVDAILKTMDLLDVHLSMTNGTGHIKNEVNKYRESRIYDSKDYSWLHWNIGNVDTRRLSTRVENNLGALLFQMLLPGTISIFYGDEIGLQEIPDPHADHSDIKDVHQLAPMKWSKNGTGFTRNDILPWLPFAKAYKNSEMLETIMHNMTTLRKDSPSIYMSSVWKENENLSNHAFRYIDQNLIILERSYPRRKSYAVVFNIGGTDVQKDLSTIYYGGELIEDIKGTNGLYFTFNSLKLRAGESYVFKLDT